MRQDAMKTFLVVDDEPDILEAIERLFRKKYRVLTAQTADEGMAIVQTHDVQVVMTDQRMPRMSGVEFLARLRQTHPEIVRVLLTGYSNIDHVIDAINDGHVYRYISKPWNPAELRLFVTQAFEYYDAQREREALVTQLQQANEKLEQQNTLLSAANEELKMLDRVKNVFMEVVSHELNTPIAVILGYGFLLRRELNGTANPVVLKALSGIDSSAGRLKSISSRIFKMLSTESVATGLHLEWTDLRGLAEQVHAQIEPFLQKRNQQLDLQICPHMEAALVDREKMSDVLVNLLMNAIKFSYDGQTIRLHLSPMEDAVQIVVEDHGIGIAEEDLAQVFDAFFSTFNSQHHSSGNFEFGKRGIGLGLSMARRFVEMHGGSIDVESAEGEGSRFTIYLPTAARAEVASHAEAAGLRH